MENNPNKVYGHRGLQAVTLCISTAMVLVLLGLVVLSVSVAHNTSALVRENLTVTLMLEQDMTSTEAQQLCKRLSKRPYIRQIDYISKEQALKEQTKAMGTDPSEFMDGENPYLPSIELTLQADYANNDSLQWIARELKKYPRVTNVSYQQDLVEQVNRTLTKVSIVLLVIAALLTFVSFALINNTVRLSVYSRRFAIHTMKLVGASWRFIRRPFLWQGLFTGILAAVLACGVLGCGLYVLYRNEPDILDVVTPEVMAVTGGVVVLFGIIITEICVCISVNKFLRMRAGDLYKI